MPWLAAGGDRAVLALALVLLVRPDPQQIAELIAAATARPAAGAGRAAGARSCAGPGVRPAMLAASPASA